VSQCPESSCLCGKRASDPASGRIPPSSLDTLIGPDECAEATKRAYRAEDIAEQPRILGVDVARFGDDPA
jgi:hypothetical protein